MTENRATRGPNWGLLLLIPAAVILAKGAMHRRAMWESGWEARDQRAAFRLPPRIEWILDTWHTRAHQTADTTEPPESTAPPTA